MAFWTLYKRELSTYFQSGGLVDAVLNLGLSIALVGPLGVRGVAIGTLAAELAERMRAALEAPCNIEDLVLTFSVGIGIAIFPEDGEDQKTLLEHADAALYAGKAAGRGSIRRYASVRPLAITG